MIQFDNSNMHDDDIVLNFEGTPISLAAEVSSMIRAIYLNLCKHSEAGGEKFKDCFINCLDLTWLSNDEVDKKLNETIVNKLKQAIEDHGGTASLKYEDEPNDNEFLNWLHSFDSDDDDDDDGDDDEWD